MIPMQIIQIALVVQTRDFYMFYVFEDSLVRDFLQIALKIQPVRCKWTKPRLKDIGKKI